MFVSLLPQVINLCCADTQKHFLRLPINRCTYHDIRMGMFYFKDITGIIPLLAAENSKAFCFLRPPRFGKSLLLEVMRCFYDINCGDKFDFYFKVCVEL